ncbi:MAG: riboflavin synthase [Alphaproteobacteria bacterium]
MYTGIITDVGRVLRVAKTAAGRRLEIETAYNMDDIALGASVACNGTCFTVDEKGSNWLAADASFETLACTTVGRWQAGMPVNLERSLRVGDELGGHMVLGHVDGVGQLEESVAEGENMRLTFAAPAEICRFIARKGSITVDGVSLTVNVAEETRFSVNIIPHTLRHTTLGNLSEGDPVNLEVDVMARYASRLLERSE